MPQRDGKSGIQPTHLGNLALSGVTPAASDWFDTREMDMATFVVLANTITDAGTVSGFSFVVEESDTTAAADATEVTDDQLIGLESDLTVTSDTADDSVAGWIGYLGSKRYARIVGTGTTGTDADVSVLGLAGALHYEPRDTPGTAVAAT